jgi:hypothetical protein
MEVIVMGMRNRLFKPHAPIGENLTGCLQRYVVLQYERTIKYLILNANNIALQIIFSEHLFDFHHIPGEMCRINPTCLGRAARRRFVA